MGGRLRPVAARDPRLRPYRFAAWLVYFALIVVSVGLLITSVVRNLRGKPRRPVEAGSLATRAALRVCMDDLDGLYREQNQRAWDLGAGFDAPEPLAAWTNWAPRWEERVEDLADRCRLDVEAGEWSAERRDIAAARDAVMALHRAYSAQVNRFALEQGDLARAAAEAMRHAREAARPSRAGP
jgi:hypothetical protein